MREGGMSQTEIAETLGVGRTTLSVPRTTEEQRKRRSMSDERQSFMRSDIVSIYAMDPHRRR
ncbi:hypothetical protein [Rhodococcus sp. SGAir0479]|uniref:hypothetical protein n=1 Tax=Rhodococcus sp. SGAir0479 TaxID=2567884 RepID=UPI002682B636